MNRRNRTYLGMVVLATAGAGVAVLAHFSLDSPERGPTVGVGQLVPVVPVSDTTKAEAPAAGSPQGRAAPPARPTPRAQVLPSAAGPLPQAGSAAVPAPEVDYRSEIYKYREPEIPDGNEKRRAYLRCEQQARHIPAGDSLPYGVQMYGSLDKALGYCQQYLR
jgi:hypothetical protein